MGLGALAFVIALWAIWAGVESIIPMMPLFLLVPLLVVASRWLIQRGIRMQIPAPHHGD